VGESALKLSGYLSSHAELNRLYEAVRSEFASKGLVHHNWGHILRDLAKAILVGEAEGADMKVLLAAVLLHDIGRLFPEMGRDHCMVGVRLAPVYLKNAGFSGDEIEEIIHCVSCYGPRALAGPRTTEARVGFDVEVLSCSVGYLGVAQVFDYFMREEKIGIVAMLDMPSGMPGQRKDFYTATGESFGAEGLRKARAFWSEVREELAKDTKATRQFVPVYNSA